MLKETFCCVFISGCDTVMHSVGYGVNVHFQWSSCGGFETEMFEVHQRVKWTG